jgi:hypothetical protein
MVTAILGVPCVATDLAEVVKMAEPNVRINCETHGIPKHRLSLQALEWGRRRTEEEEVSCGGGMMMSDTKYDLILAADCLYATATVTDLDVKLLQTLQSLMGPNSLLLVAYTVRSGNEPLFFSSKLANHGFQYKEVGVQNRAMHIMEVTRNCEYIPCKVVS